MRNVTYCLMALMFLALLCGPGASGAMGAEHDRQPVVNAGQVNGRIADSLGNAGGGLAVEALDGDETVIADTVSDSDGRFELELGTDVHTIRLDGQHSFRVRMAAERGVSELSLIVPARSYSAGQDTTGSFPPNLLAWATEEGGYLGLSNAGGLAVGVLAGGAAGATIGHNSRSDSSDSDVVSP